MGSARRRADVRGGHVRLEVVSAAERVPRRMRLPLAGAALILVVAVIVALLSGHGGEPANNAVNDAANLVSNAADNANNTVVADANSASAVASASACCFT